MKIIGNESEILILKEIGQRIKQQRIAMNVTQAELSERCGVSLSTEMRIENGVDSKFSNYIKILSVLNFSGNLDVLIPEPQPNLKDYFEEKPARQRASHKKSTNKTAWIWGEDR